MQYYGYAGKILHVDLTNSTIRKEELDVEMAKNFIGGMGISSKLAYELIKPGIDPLSPENVLVYGVSPFTGTFMPGFPRAGMISKSPLTGFLAESNTGNSIGPMLKYAGYDHLVITGRAKNPVCLVINNDDVEIKDASNIWGMDTFETADAIRHELGEQYWTSCIGPGGENLVRFACIIENKNGMLGRTGLGAVAGSKNLKAIAVRGTKGIKVYSRREFRKLAEEMRDRIAKSPLIDVWRNEGQILDGYVVPFVKRGVYLSRNWAQSAIETMSSLTQKEFAEHVWKKYYACFGCPCGCKGIIGVDRGKYQVQLFKLSNPWGTPSLYSECGAKSWDECVKPAELASRYGIDSFSTTRIISWAIELYKRGIISKKDTDGVELDWNVDTILALIEKIVHKEGIGAILAEGVKNASKEIGKGSEKYAVHVKGLSPTMDIRASLFLENFSQLVDPRGAHHGRGWAITYVPRKLDSIKRYASSIGIPSEAIGRITTDSQWNLPRLLKWVHDFDSMAFSFGLCMRPQMMANYDLETLTRLYSITTGIELSPEELLKAGERIWNIQRLFNAREGASRKDDMPPPRMLTESVTIGDVVYPPVKEGYIQVLLDEYYDERGWDIATGNPSEQKLIELGLKSCIEKRGDKI